MAYNSQTFETTGFNPRMRELYEAPEGADLSGVCTPEWFATLLAAITACRKVGAAFKRLDVALNEGDVKAVAFQALYEPMRAENPRFPPLHWKGVRGEKGGKEDLRALLAQVNAQQNARLAGVN